MYYIIKKNAYGDFLFWNARKKNFSYMGGSKYASQESAVTAFSLIVNTYNISSDNVEIYSHESILNHYQKVTSI